MGAGQLRSSRGTGGLALFVAPTFALVLACALVACGRDPSGGTPNLLLITLDTLRADHCSVYGYGRATTPRLEEFAREGVRFEQAFAPMATTGPSHASMFTGLYPAAHRIVKNGLLLPDAHETLAERLQAAGYLTGGVASSFVLDQRFGYAQGFETWADEFTLKGSSTHMPDWEGHRVEGGFDRRADAATRRAVRWLEKRTGQGSPFFLFVHYFDPHNPYDPPPAQAASFPPAGAGPLAEAVARYDAEIAFTDEQVGALLDALDRLGLAENTLVVIAGDHGEGLMDHGHMEHGAHIYDETVRVPLLARWPGALPARRVVREPVELVDLAPTLLGLLEQPPLEAAQGRDLSAAWRGEATLDGDHPVFIHRRHYEPGFEGSTPVAGEKLGIRMGGWKYIVGAEEGTHELFDLRADPDELQNLHDARPREADRLAKRLAAWLQATVVLAEASGSLSEDDRLRLEALGYTR